MYLYKFGSRTVFFPRRFALVMWKDKDNISFLAIHTTLILKGGGGGDGSLPLIAAFKCRRKYRRPRRKHRRCPPCSATPYLVLEFCTAASMHGSVSQVRYRGVAPSVHDSGSLPWTVSLGGRFLAPFLRNLGLTDVEIGLALALQLGLMTMLGPWGGKLADVMEKQNPGRGRAQVLTTGIM
jgi:hypothetical protein